MPHLLAVWDPSRRPDAMAETIRTLQTRVRRARAAGGDEAIDDATVWWGKIRSPNRQQPLPHLADVLALDDVLRGEAVAEEVQLYLTDYRSLYVAHVCAITADDPRPTDPDFETVPAGVYPAGVACDCWFELWDVRRLVADDTREVVAELRKLRNLRYDGRPVSLYGGMVDLPLLVERPDGMRFFGDEMRERLTEGQLWLEFDAEQGGTASVAASLRDDVLGERTWHALDPAARLFVATAERIWRTHRTDPGFDFAPVVVNLAKAWEVQLGQAFGAARARLPRDAGRVNVDGRTHDVLADRLPSLGMLARALADDRVLWDALPRVFAHGDWMRASLAAVLDDLARARNAAAHTEPVGRDEAQRLRDAHLGVGQKGLLVELGWVEAKG